MPLLLIYGALQPFLPAGLIAQSLAPIWQGISAWRSLGWTLILALLICAPVHAIVRRNRDGVVNMLIVVVWISILVAALRGGGDLWDNPRYRLPFLPIQASLAAWVLLEQQRSPDPWFRRLLAGIIAVLLWFIPFYLRRYTEINWPVADLFKTLGLGLATAVLYGLWDWTRRPLTGKARGL
jgi:hypothetical protein